MRNKRFFYGEREVEIKIKDDYTGTTLDVISIEDGTVYKNVDCRDVEVGGSNPSDSQHNQLEFALFRVAQLRAEIKELGQSAVNGVVDLWIVENSVGLKSVVGATNEEEAKEAYCKFAGGIDNGSFRKFRKAYPVTDIVGTVYYRPIERKATRKGPL